MTKKHITIDDLAVMVKKGFDEIGGNFNSLKREFNDLKSEVIKIRADILDIKERLENLEKITLKHYNFEIQDLKRRVKHLEDLFAIK